MANPYSVYGLYGAILDNKIELFLEFSTYSIQVKDAHISVLYYASAFDLFSFGRLKGTLSYHSELEILSHIKGDGIFARTGPAFKCELNNSANFKNGHIAFLNVVATGCWVEIWNFEKSKLRWNSTSEMFLLHIWALPPHVHNVSKAK